MLKHRKVIRQHDAKDCGAACLVMISRYYKRNISIALARQLTKTDKNGTTIFGLVNGSQKIGLDADALSGSPTELLKAITNKNISFPFIAHIISNESMYHFIVIYAFKNNRFIIGDPARGSIILDCDSFFKQWTGNLVTFSKSSDFQELQPPQKKLSTFYSLLKGQVGKLSTILLASLIASFIGIISAFIFQTVIDNFSTETGYETGHHHTEDTEDITDDPFDSEDYGQTAKGFNILYKLMQALSKKTTTFSFHNIFIVVIILYLIKALLEFIRGYLIVLISKKVDIGITLSYYNHIINMPLDSVSTRQTGEYLSRLSDADAVRNGISTVTVTLIFDSIMALCGGLILFLLSEKLFYISLGMMCLYAIVFVAYKKKIERANRKVMEKNAIVQSFFKESIDGIETIKAYSIEKDIKQKSTNKFKAFVDSIVKNSLLAMSQDVIAEAVELIGTIIILWVGFSMVLSGQLKIGLLMTYYVLIGYFTGPIKNLIQLQPTIQKALVAAERLNDILEIPLEPQCTSISLNTINQIAYQNVDFRYGNRALVLSDISFVIEQGQKIAFVGESGCGKTTLAKLLLGFYEIESGNILINNCIQTKASLIQLRNHIAYVAQNDYFFADTIKNNLILDNTGISNAEIRAACHLCNIDDFIQQLPSAYNTPIDENGSNLSAGQRQRLAIARALLRKPNILILDEATSNLDPSTENIIRKNILKLDITCIIIAHRLTTVKQCDCIHVIENGTIIESGSHQDLLTQNGAYSKLWESQS